MSTQRAPTLHESAVRAEWIDEYGHMNLAWYVHVCDQATYAFWERVNGERPIEARGGAEYAVVETHVNYLRELREGDRLRVTTQLLGADAKRFRIFHTLYHAADDAVAATNEVMALGFDLGARRLAPFPAAVRARLEALLAEHARLPFPENAGRAIGMGGAR